MLSTSSIMRFDAASKFPLLQTAFSIFCELMNLTDYNTFFHMLILIQGIFIDSRANVELECDQYLRIVYLVFFISGVKCRQT